MTPDERQEFANICEEAVAHPLVQNVIDEYRHNMRQVGVDLSSGTLEYYGLLKVLTAATQVARAQALGIDPHDLIMTKEEQMEHMMRLAGIAAEAGKLIMVEVPEAEG